MVNRKDDFMKKLKHIDIVLENCEVIQVPAHCIYYFGLINVTNNKSMHVNNHYPLWIVACR